jgi:hypothetical protein
MFGIIRNERTAQRNGYLRFRLRSRRDFFLLPTIASRKRQCDNLAPKITREKDKLLRGAGAPQSHIVGQRVGRSSIHPYGPATSPGSVMFSPHFAPNRGEAPHERDWFGSHFNRVCSHARSGAGRLQRAINAAWCAGALGSYAWPGGLGATYLDHARTRHSAFAHEFFGATGDKAATMLVFENLGRAAAAGCNRACAAEETIDARAACFNASDN